MSRFNIAARSTTSQIYYLLSLLARLAAFAALVIYAVFAPEAFSHDLHDTSRMLTPLTVVWLLLIASMIFRLMPSQLESLGCQKIYPHRFEPTGVAVSREEIRRADRGALWVLVSWLGVNSLFFAGYFLGWLDERFLICLAGFYGVCDIVCILFFCPFQAWMMHNRCCITCRIFSWDYLMLCTPLFVIRSLLTAVACLLSLVIFIHWEITYRNRRERFFVCSNEALRCSADCPEKLCRYKRACSRSRRPKP